MKKFILTTLIIAAFAALGCNNIRHISGAVYGSNDKLPIPGAAVQLDGSTTVITHTKADGSYSIDVPEGKDRLQFSFSNFNSKRISITSTDTLNVYLDPANSGELSSNDQPKRRSYKNDHNTDSPNTTLPLMGPTGITDNHIADAGRDAEKKQPVDDSQSPNPYNQPDYSSTVPAYNNRSAKAYSPVYRVNPDISRESYQRIHENRFNDLQNNLVSTFSVDVDAASYSNIRRFINNGQLPPTNAVRVEEMINYFKYDLPEPSKNDPVSIVSEVSSAPWSPTHRLVRISLKAREANIDHLPPANLVFLLDVSGSMAKANKLPVVQAAMKMLADQLRPEDHVAIVTYSGQAGLKLASTPGDEKEVIKNAIDQLHAAGSTAGAGGIRMAYAIARQNFIEGGNNRIIMATDGDFNVGESSDADMEKLIARERYSNVPITILGVGMGNLKDSKMEILADKGNGNYAYIDNLTEATRALVDNYSGTMMMVAKDVKLQVEFNPAKVQAYRLLGYEDRLLNKEDFNNDMKDAGDMGAGHTVTALYEIVPQGFADDYSRSTEPLKYQQPKNNPSTPSSDELMTVKFRYKQPGSDYSKMSVAVVKDQPASFYAMSADFRFASAVAEFGMLLRNSQFKQRATYNQAISIARNARGKDESGYRSEFVRLAETAKSLATTDQYIASNY